MTSDPRREVVARALAKHCGDDYDDLWQPDQDHYLAGADAVLAALPEYEQVGSRWHDGKQVATYIVREPSTPTVEASVHLCGAECFDDDGLWMPKMHAAGAVEPDWPDDWHPDVLAENAHARIDPPSICPTCGSDERWKRQIAVSGRPCTDPFHSQGEPCDLCEGCGVWFQCDDQWCENCTHGVPCPRGCNPGEPEGATP